MTLETEGPQDANHRTRISPIRANACAGGQATVTATPPRRALDWLRNGWPPEGLLPKGRTRRLQSLGLELT